MSPLRGHAHLTQAEYVACLRADSDRLAAAARGRLDAPIPSCPEWTMQDLVGHTGGVQNFWCQIAERRLSDPRQGEAPEIPSDDSVIDWFGHQSAHLADVLESADPDAPCWSWSGQKEVGFIIRRMAQETSIHRFDAELGAGAPQPIVPPELARDGVDELLDTFLPADDRELTGGSGTIHLHQTDGQGEWVLTLTPRGVEVDHSHAKGDAAVRATGSDLVLLLWQRIGLDDVEVLGDPPPLERLLAWMDLD
ncbi:maleylpyruvate isomerase family mycothiol-dependent enzyme [soil metagenome]